MHCFIAVLTFYQPNGTSASPVTCLTGGINYANRVPFRERWNEVSVCESEGNVSVFLPSSFFVNVMRRDYIWVADLCSFNLTQTPPAYRHLLVILIQHHERRKKQWGKLLIHYISSWTPTRSSRSLVSPIQKMLGMVRKHSEEGEQRS